jgi:hypothetical protein
LLAACMKYVDRLGGADAGEFNDKRKEVRGVGAVGCLIFGNCFVWQKSLVRPSGGCWVAGRLHERYGGVGGEPQNTGRHIQDCGVGNAGGRVPL